VPQKRATTRQSRATDVALPTGTVTFLFTDIEGSTHLLQQAGNAYGDLLAEHRRLLRASFAAHAGREVDTQGDAFFVAFSSPTRAVAAAVEGQRALAAHPWPPGSEVRVRMGLHTGEASTVDGSYVSVAVHRAARIAAAAHGGQVLLSDATASLVRNDLPDGVHLHDLGEHRLKDFDAPARLFQLDLVGLPIDFAPLKALGRRTAIPTPAGPFVGRDSEVAGLATLLRGHGTRLVTLTGPGGIGKTRLALEAAHAVAADFPGGAVFLPLAAVTDHRIVLGAVADALGTRRAAGVDVHEAVAAVVGADRTLLILDNVEQIAAAAADVAELVDRVPALVVLVTSRAVLRLRAEQQFPVRPLEERDAERLFQERAAAVRPGFDPDADERAAVREICRRLDGVPLAIELATARMRLLRPRALLDLLAVRLDVLGAGPVDLPVRQRTLRATVDWSLGLLSAHEQSLFARLAVFVGGWGLDAAEHVCGRPGEPPVLDTLAALVDASLVVPDEAGPEPRFSMLETIRAYAVERLADAEDRAETERRHGDWALALTHQLLRTRGRDYQRVSARVDREQANLRAAARRMLDRGDVASLALLVRNGIAHLALRDAEVEAVRWVDEALELPGSAEPAVRARLIVLRAVFGVALGDVARLPDLVAEARPLLPADDDFGMDRALAAVAAIQTGFRQGPAQGLAAAEEALACFTAIGLEAGEASMNQAIGELALAMGDPARAAVGYRTAAHKARAIGEDGMLGIALSLLGISQLAQGDVVAARSSMLEGAQASHRSGQPTSIAYSLEGLAGLALAEGRPAVAARALAASAAARGRSALPLTPALPPVIGRMVDQCRELLGAVAFEEATAEGGSWTLLDALQRTLDDSEPDASRVAAGA
jgi:predicted ATPase/class 3 adenylate cyclase